jgi:hypothetical protein
MLFNKNARTNIVIAKAKGLKFNLYAINKIAANTGTTVIAYINAPYSKQYQKFKYIKYNVNAAKIKIKLLQAIAPDFVSL